VKVTVVGRSNRLDEQRLRNVAHGLDAMVFHGPLFVHAKPFCRTLGFKLFNRRKSACRDVGQRSN
jgi:hypothetical protein